MSKINAQDEVRSTQKQKMETERALGFGVPCMQVVYSVSYIIGQGSAWLSQAVPRRLRVH